MAIALDTSTDFGFQLGAGNLSGSYTCSGVNRLLVVATFGSVGTDDVTGVTYNGVSLTKLGSTLVNLDRYCTFWYLLAPATGSNTLTATYGGSNAVGMVAASYTGVAQSGQPDSSASGSIGSNANIIFSTTVVAANCWLITCSKNTVGATSANTGGSVTPTVRQGGSSGLAIADSNGTISTGVQSMQLTTGNAGTHWGGYIASFSPATAAATVTQKNFSLNQAVNRAASY